MMEFVGTCLRRIFRVDETQAQLKLLENLACSQREEIEKLRLSLADLRENLDMDPMVELRRELDDLREPQGDPMMGG